MVDIPSYLTGFIDGEGCFMVSISPRRSLAVGWEVRPSVSASQNADRSEVLYLLQRYFGCGTLRRDPSDLTLKWETRSLRAILDHVIPHFQRFPLLSGKRRDLELFERICRWMDAGEHRTKSGLVRIAQTAGKMNPSGRRTYPPEVILKDLSEVKA